MIVQFSGCLLSQVLFHSARLFEKITRWPVALICSSWFTYLFSTFSPLHRDNRFPSLSLSLWATCLFSYKNYVCWCSWRICFQSLNLEKSYGGRQSWMVPCIKATEFSYWAIMLAVEMFRLGSTPCVWRPCPE